MGPKWEMHDDLRCEFVFLFCMQRFTFGAFVCACVCVCQHCVWQWCFSLSAFNWLIMVTMVTVLWKSSLPTTTEMPPAHLNVIFGCCLHLNRRLASQLFVQCLFYWLFCSVVLWLARWHQWYICSCAAILAVACTPLKVAVVMFRVAWCWFAWVCKICFAWTSLHVILYYIYTSASIAMCTNVQQLNHFPFSTILSNLIGISS